MRRRTRPNVTVRGITHARSGIETAHGWTACRTSWSRRRRDDAATTPRGTPTKADVDCMACVAAGTRP